MTDKHKEALAALDWFENNTPDHEAVKKMAKTIRTALQEPEVDVEDLRQYANLYLGYAPDYKGRLLTPEERNPGVGPISTYPLMSSLGVVLVRYLNSHAGKEKQSVKPLKHNQPQPINRNGKTYWPDANGWYDIECAPRDESAFLLRKVYEDITEYWTARYEWEGHLWILNDDTSQLLVDREDHGYEWLPDFYQNHQKAR